MHFCNLLHFKNIINEPSCALSQQIRCISCVLSHQPVWARSLIWFNKHGLKRTGPGSGSGLMLKRSHVIIIQCHRKIAEAKVIITNKGLFKNRISLKWLICFIRFLCWWSWSIFNFHWKWKSRLKASGVKNILSSGSEASLISQQCHSLFDKTEYTENFFPRFLQQCRCKEALLVQKSLNISKKHTVTKYK